jgi:DNA-binding beta-propeller fold protein YncE
LAIALAVGAIGLFILRPASVEAGEMLDSPFRQRVRVPPLPEGLEWLNTAGPLELADLRGKFVLMDFWTYCCINCMHILPELKQLERAYPNNLVVIGVHSAKFETEKDSKNIVEAILRYQIEHPVINDANLAVWKRFGASAWPTIVLIDPEGYAVWGTSGEITAEQVDKILKPALSYYRKKGLLDETPLRFDLETHRAQASPLRFPGKVLADEASGRLFIADSNHHRIVIVRFDGTLLQTVGSGAMGRADGDFASAQFNQPQGMALDGQSLYVADTENHLIRKVDLAAGKVATVAGVGQQAREPPPLGKLLPPLKAALSSPWDLCLHQRDLYIAMAGPHQIWRMRLDRPGIGPYAGNGREDIVDGRLLPERPYQLGSSSFAQPSGLATDGRWLYVADSEGSSIRAVPLDPRKEVRTVVGTAHLPAARLFTFGDVDGPAGQARFQHPLGVAFYQGRLYVADTYNNKLKMIDPATGAVKTLVGTGKPGRTDNPATFDEPAGIAAAAGKLFVADTNNHLIRVVDLADRSVSTLTIAGLQPPKAPANDSAEVVVPGTIEQRVDPVSVRRENGQIRLEVRLELPAGMKINPAAPMSYRLDLAGEKPEGGLIAPEVLGKPTRVGKPAATFAIPLAVASPTGRQTLRVSVMYYYCRAGAEGLCKMGSAVWIVPIEVAEQAATTAVALRHRVR